MVIEEAAFWKLTYALRVGEFPRGWFPSIDSDVPRVLDRCDSLLEKMEYGPSVLEIEPQCRRGYAFDFGVFTDSGLYVLVEVDGYAIHRKQRRWGATKAREAPAPVIRLLEETEGPKDWPWRLLDWSCGSECPHCDLWIGGDHFPCPPRIERCSHCGRSPCRGDCPPF